VSAFCVFRSSATVSNQPCNFADDVICFLQGSRFGCSLPSNIECYILHGEKTVKDCVDHSLPTWSCEMLAANCRQHLGTHMVVVKTSKVLNRLGITLIWFGWAWVCSVQLVEIVPSALVLYILRKMPPKRMGGQYHPIRWRKQLLA
jgi:hypothetical protein